MMSSPQLARVLAVVAAFAISVTYACNDEGPGADGPLDAGKDAWIPNDAPTGEASVGDSSDVVSAWPDCQHVQVVGGFLNGAERAYVNDAVRRTNVRDQGVLFGVTEDLSP